MDLTSWSSQCGVHHGLALVWRRVDVRSFVSSSCRARPSFQEHLLSLALVYGIVQYGTVYIVFYRTALRTDQ